MNFRNKLECLSMVAFQAKSKQTLSNLLQKLVNYGQKSFITSGPGSNV
jgi:hypothetical protein